MDWRRKFLEIDWSSAVSESHTICDVQFDQRITLTYLQAPPKAIQDMTAGKENEEFSDIMQEIQLPELN